MNTLMRDPDGPLARLLIAYYGVVEIVHAIALVQAGIKLMVTGTIGFPASPPPEGWSAQVIPFLVAMGAMDAVNVVIAIAFVYAYFSRARWRWGVGTVTLTAAAYSAVVFAYGTMASGAWIDNPIGYLSVAVVFGPVAALMVSYATWGLRGSLTYSET